MKEPESYSRFRIIVKGILEDQQQNMLNSQKERSGRQSSTGVSFEKQVQRKGLSSKGSCSRGAKCSFEHDSNKEGKRQRTNIKTPSHPGDISWKASCKHLKTSKCRMGKDRPCIRLQGPGRSTSPRQKQKGEDKSENDREFP